VVLAAYLGHPGPAPGKPRGPATPLVLSPGPLLFLDDSLVETSSRLRRVINVLGRERPRPLVTGKEHRNDQPYVTVLRDPKSRRCRTWCDASGDRGPQDLFALGYLQSDDAIRWERPHRLLQGPPGMRWGASVLDGEPDFPDRRMRYNLAWWQKGGLMLAYSSDGLGWKPLLPI